MYKALLTSVATLITLSGCAANKLSPDEISKLKGGTTTVVAYGFCVPMDYIVQTAITRATMDIVVDGQVVGTMQTCSFATFKVKSGYWNIAFKPQGLLGGGANLGEEVFKPGVTQYLSMQPAGYGQFSGSWVSKADADQGIAAIRKIGQVF
jgi:hypothetical protein